MKYDFCLFETSAGWIGLVWTENGILRLQLPENSKDATRKRLVEGLEDIEEVTPSESWIVEIILKIQKHLNGIPQDFSEVDLDLNAVPPFHKRVYLATRKIPPGKTRSYGELAKQIRSPGAARAVGQALARNPIGLIVPCHRVLAANKKPGGFSAYGGFTTKRKMLLNEGVVI